MAVQRIVPNLQAADPDVADRFFTGVLGLEVAMQLPDFITTYRVPGQAPTQISVIKEDPSGLFPAYSVGVDDVDAAYRRAVEQGLTIVYPLQNEPWGVRRFFVRDPSGAIANIVEHLS